MNNDKLINELKNEIEQTYLKTVNQLYDEAKKNDESPLTHLFIYRFYEKIILSNYFSKPPDKIIISINNWIISGNSLFIDILYCKKSPQNTLEHIITQDKYKNLFDETAIELAKIRLYNTDFFKKQEE